MKIISDIRLYKSTELNTHTDIGNKEINIAVKRVVMKLREYNFSLGEFDHLYLNFTICKPKGTFELIDEVDSYHPWYRYCNIGVTQSEYENLTIQLVYEKISLVFVNLFNIAEDVIQDAITEAQKGSEMQMFFKEKKSAKATATIFLRLLDSGKYFPLLRVTDLDGQDLLCKDLPETFDLNSIGEIQLSTKKVTIKPRKNAFTMNLKPISFEL
ncbi:MAG: hypothetical protein IJN82_00875 [Clostridia bacterium]|nr:hypothetical protein [Clostridia bacterium]